MTSSIRALAQSLLLQMRQLATDLDDPKPRPLIHLGMHIPNIIQNIEHHSSIASAHFVDVEVVVWIKVIFIIFDEVAGYGLSVVGREKLGGRVPQLAQVIGLLVVESVFEIGITVAELLEEDMFGGHIVEVERFAGGEDDYLFGEVAIIWVV